MGPAGRGGWSHAYAIGKGAGYQFVLTLHAEYADQGIRAVNINPGYVATEHVHATGAANGFDP